MFLSHWFFLSGDVQRELLEVWDSALVQDPQVSSQHHLPLTANSRSHFNIPHSWAVQTLLSPAHAAGGTVTFWGAPAPRALPRSPGCARQRAQHRRDLAGAHCRQRGMRSSPRSGGGSQTPGFPWQLLLLLLELAVGLQLQFPEPGLIFVPWLLAN